MDKETLKNVIEDHRLWIEDKGGARADLYKADLHGADLRGANLHGANLYGANLHGANLREADLHGANLREADLHGANLYKADLRGANLYGANLCGANLYGADLCGADLHRADLHEADIDFSVLPIWCGGLRWKIGVRIAAQLAYHFCSMDCDDPDFLRARNSILDFANRFHRVYACGTLKPGELE